MRRNHPFVSNFLPARREVTPFEIRFVLSDLITHLHNCLVVFTSLLRILNVWKEEICTCVAGVIFPCYIRVYGSAGRFNKRYVLWLAQICARITLLL